MIGKANILILSLLHITALARLGDQKAQTQQSRAQRISNYRMESRETPMYRMEEYIDDTGFVFAVSWSGVGRPDLSETLGEYFEEFKLEDSARPKMYSRAPVVVKTSNIVVRRDGHPRALHGSAFVKDRIPAGFDPRDL